MAASSSTQLAGDTTQGLNLVSQSSTMVSAVAGGRLAQATSSTRSAESNANSLFISSSSQR